MDAIESMGAHIVSHFWLWQIIGIAGAACVFFSPLVDVIAPRPKPLRTPVFETWSRGYHTMVWGGTVLFIAAALCFAALALSKWTAQGLL